jgi:hypothetical protein
MIDQLNMAAATLARELNVSEDLAKSAVLEANGALGKARAILLELLPRYLFVKVRFLSTKTDGKAGLAFLCLEKGSDDFLLFDLIVESNREWLKGIGIQRSPDTFYRHLKDYHRENINGPMAHESSRMNQELRLKLQPQVFKFVFDKWEQPKQDLVAESGHSKEAIHPAALLAFIIENMIADITVQKMSAEVDYDFLSVAQFGEISDELGLYVEKPAAVQVVALPQVKPDREDEPFRIYFKGQFIIDPISGRLLEEVMVGDLLYCEIVDRSDMAVAAARLIGAYKRGLWVPVRGLVVDVQQMTGERRKYCLKLAPGVFVDVLSFTGVRVRTQPYAFPEVMNTIKEAQLTWSPAPVIFAAALVVLLVIALFLTR